MSAEFPYRVEINTVEHHYPAHRHNYVEISYVLEGRARELTGGRQRLIGPGTLSVILPHQIHEITVLDAGLLRLYNLCVGLDLFLDDSRARELFNSVLYRSDSQGFIGIDVPIESQPTVRTAFEAMADEGAERRPWSEVRVYALMIDLLVRAVRQRPATVPETVSSPGGPSESRIWDVVSYVYHNYTDDLSLAELAERFSISAPYLSARFRQTVGESYLSFLNGLRTDHALGLIRRGTLTLSQIADACGYNSYSSFSRMFRKHHGASPKAVRDAAEGESIQAR